MPVEEVVRIVAECVSTFKRVFDKDSLSSFRSRARETPALIFSRGLAYAIVCVASRSSEAVFGIGLNASKCSDLSARVREHIKSVGAEESGYVLYGALLAFAMKVYDITTGLTSGDPLRELVEVSLKDPVANTRALEVAEWIKRFTEAYIAE